MTPFTFGEWFMFYRMGALRIVLRFHWKHRYHLPALRFWRGGGQFFCSHCNPDRIPEIRQSLKVEPPMFIPEWMAKYGNEFSEER